jgi:hypothetical protein
MYSLERFKEKFLENDFDNYLLEQNNPFVNSNRHYLQLKNNYLDKTRENFDKFKNLLEIYNRYMNIYKVNKENNECIFMYIDETKKKSINKQLKDIILEQNRNLDILMKHIKLLNEKKNLITN